MLTFSNSYSKHDFNQYPSSQSPLLGSILRLSQLLSIKHALDNGKDNVTKEDLKKVEDISINEIVKTQLDLGFHAVTDGYLSDNKYFADIVAAVHRKKNFAFYTQPVTETFKSMIQISYTFCSEKKKKMLAGFKTDVEDLNTLFDSYIESYNDCLRKRPGHIHIEIHLYRRNFINRRPFPKGNYNTIAIATKSFQYLNIDTYSVHIILS